MMVGLWERNRSGFKRLGDILGINNALVFFPWHIFRLCVGAEEFQELENEDPKKTSQSNLLEGQNVSNELVNTYCRSLACEIPSSSNSGTEWV